MNQTVDVSRDGCVRRACPEKSYVSECHADAIICDLSHEDTVSL